MHGSNSEPLLATAVEMTSHGGDLSKAQLLGYKDILIGGKRFPCPRAKELNCDKTFYSMIPYMYISRKTTVSHFSSFARGQGKHFPSIDMLMEMKVSRSRKSEQQDDADEA